MRYIALTFVGLSLCFGETPKQIEQQIQPKGYVLGKVSGAAPVAAGNTELAADGVPTWPIAVGDDLRTGPSKALVSLKEKSHIEMDKQSHVIVESLGEDRGLFHIRLGGLLIKAAEKSMVGVCVLNVRIDAIGPAQGIVQLKPDRTILMKADGNFIIDPRRSCTPKIGLATRAAPLKSGFVESVAGGGAVAGVAEYVKDPKPAPVSPSQPSQ